MRRDASWSVLAFVVYAALGALQTVAVARHLGPEGKGFVTLLMIAPTVTAWSLSLGFTSANMYLSAARPGLRHQLLTMSAVAAAVLGGGAGIVAWSIFGQELQGEVRGAFLVAVILVPVLLLSEFHSAVLIGAGHVVEISKASMLARMLSVGLLVYAVYFHDRSIAFFAVPIGLTIGYLVVAAVSWSILRWRWRWDPSITRDELRFGLRSHVGGVSEIGILRFDHLIVFSLLGPLALGLYSVAVLLGEALTLFGHALATSAFSRLATYETRDARALALRLCVFAFCLTALGAIPLVILSEALTGLVFGSGFAPATPLVGILAIGAAFQATGRVAIGALRARARPLLASGAYLVGMAVTLPLILILIPRLGLAGAAVASLIGYVAFCLAAVVALRAEPGQLSLAWARQQVWRGEVER